MSKDRSPYILIAGLVAIIIIGMSCAYALADDAKPVDPLPFKVALGLTISGPDGKDVPLGFAVVAGGFATEAECMGKKGADAPAFHKFVKKFVTDLTNHIGVPVKAKAGCIDVTKLPKDDKPVPGEEKL